MDFGRDNYQDFFEKLRSNDGPRNLRQIFEDDDKPLQNESNNLRYQPQSSAKQQQQKKPKSDESTAPPSDQNVATVDSWTTVVAKVAQGYNGSEDVGRVGVALSRNSAGAVKLVVYKTKRRLLSTLLLTKSVQSTLPRPGLPRVILRESYMQFYDDKQRFWSLRFEVAKDEDEFTEALINFDLPINKMRDEQTVKAIAEDLPTTVAIPQPLPRHQISATAAPTSYESESESTQSTEEIINTQRIRPVSRSLVSLATSNSVALTPTLSPTPSSKLEIYLDEQRATGHAIDKKMDTILQAMCHLTTNGKVPCIESTPSDTATSESTESNEANKMDTILKAMERLVATNNNMNQLNESLETMRGATDNEDELLELEQKLLNFKKENRALMRNLKAKEQALADLRASTCALCEELLAQNNELKLQNTTLISAMSCQPNTSNAALATCDSSNCSNCEQNLIKIAGLERRLAALQSVLLNLTSNGTTAMSSATTSSLMSAALPH